MSEREQFESWVKFHSDDDEVESNLMMNAAGTNYLHADIDNAWIAWRASREALKAEQGDGGWIACADRMPKDDDFVYIWPFPDFGVELHVGQYCECHPKGDGWYAQVYENNYGIEWHKINVTHWQPLPSPPATNHPIDTTPNQYDALGKGGEQ